tara:strand:- start:2061 stop:2309 length:249 start_codon:yes stop_codon:yes gene_type:complete
MKEILITIRTILFLLLEKLSDKIEAPNPYQLHKEDKVQYPRLEMIEDRHAYILIDTDVNYEEVRTEISGEEGHKLLKRWGRR